MQNSTSTFGAEFTYLLIVHLSYVCFAISQGLFRYLDEDHVVVTFLIQFCKQKQI